MNILSSSRYGSRGRSGNSLHRGYGSRRRSGNNLRRRNGSRGRSRNSLHRRYGNRGGRQSEMGGVPRRSNKNAFILQNFENSVIFSKKRIK
jgi:hypothetical protein